jgi:hypothetical protein
MFTHIRAASLTLSWVLTRSFIADPDVANLFDPTKGGNAVVSATFQNLSAGAPAQGQKLRQPNERVCRRRHPVGGSQGMVAAVLANEQQMRCRGPIAGK